MVVEALRREDAVLGVKMMDVKEFLAEIEEFEGISRFESG